MNVDLARIQFAFTTINHFFFVPVTMGLAFLTALLQTAWHRSRRDEYLRLTRFFGTLLVLLALAAVPRGLQQRGQERQPDRDRDEEEMVDRHERELHPRQINVRHWSPPVSDIAPGLPTRLCLGRGRAGGRG